MIIQSAIEFMRNITFMDSSSFVILSTTQVVANRYELFLRIFCPIVFMPEKIRRVGIIREEKTNEEDEVKKRMAAKTKKDQYVQASRKEGFRSRAA